MAGGVHEGHRQRMKERYLKAGLDSFSPHEVVELMLYYAIPQKDVNELAHTLIERFGSFAGLIEADYEDILSVKGMGPNSALMFCLYRDVARRYLIDSSEVPFVYDSIEKIGQYFVNFFVGVTVERLYAMLFDNRMKLIDTILLEEGSVNSVNMPIRKMLSKISQRSASAIVLAHNHPNGTAYPSNEDIMNTRQIKEICDMMGLTLIDHIVVSGKYYTPILLSRKNAFMASGDPFESRESTEQFAARNPFDKE